MDVSDATREPELQTADGAVCDLEMVCPNCLIAMYPEHAHFRCSNCGYRDSCCF